MIRRIYFNVVGGTKVNPSTRQWGGMQYEDNVTEVIFNVAELGLANAIGRIDFNSAGAGYQPGENVDIEANRIRRAIPKIITQYGGEAQVTAVITVLDEEGNDTGVCYSYPETVYFTAVEKSEQSSRDVESNISAMEQSIKQTADGVAAMHDELKEVYFSAEELVGAKESAEELVQNVESRLANDEFRGEQGVSGVYVGSGEMPEGYNVQIDPEGSVYELPEVDQTYDPESRNAQSGTAVAEAVSGKADKPKDYELIETITLQEDVSLITRDTEPDGTAYSFKEIYVAFNWINGMESGKWVKLGAIVEGKRFDGFRAYSMANAGCTSWIMVPYFHGKRIFIMSDSTTNWGYGEFMAQIPARVITSTAPIEGIVLEHQAIFKAGTIIEIWGVRA